MQKMITRREEHVFVELKLNAYLTKVPVMSYNNAVFISSSCFSKWAVKNGTNDRNKNRLDDRK